MFIKFKGGCGSGFIRVLDFSLIRDVEEILFLDFIYWWVGIGSSFKVIYFWFLLIWVLGGFEFRGNIIINSYKFICVF